MNKDLQKIIKLSYSFSGVERDMFYPESDRPENDSEHSFQLALVAWHIIEKDELPLNKEKVFKIALAHDLVEIHAGDVPLWGKNGHDEKVENEAKAVKTLEADFPENKDLIQSILEYKGRSNPEARFVHALDKLLPFINQINTEGRIWKKHGITLIRTPQSGHEIKTCPLFVLPI